MGARYLKFIVSRALGTGVDTLVLWLLAHYVFSGGYVATYIISPIISFECAVMSNFLCSYFWIWRERVTDRNRRSFGRHLLSFNLSAIAGFLVKMLFLLLFERVFGWGVVVCNLMGLSISGILNFFLSESVVFRKSKPHPEHTLLTEEELSTLHPIFRGNMGKLLARIAMRILGVDSLNILYDNIYPYEGVEGARKALEQIGCNYLIGNAERLSKLPRGPFITISNHPYGGLDGVILLDMIGHLRPDLKIMANKILGRVESMSEYFIMVTPTESEKHSADAVTIMGIRTCIRHLQGGHPLCFFPAGAVSNLHPRNLSILDREWQEGAIKLFQKAKVPIVPIHFEGRNSLFYYILGLVDWQIRLLRLPHEILNKGKGVHRVTIGPIISAEEQGAIASTKALQEFLRGAVYNMPKADVYTPSSELFAASQVPLGIVSKSIENG